HPALHAGRDAGAGRRGFLTLHLGIQRAGRGGIRLPRRTDRTGGRCHRWWIRRDRGRPAVVLVVPGAAACKKLRCTRFAQRQSEGERGMKAANILETIGNTPHIRINRLFGNRAEVWMKSERANPGASIKDRIALSMIEDAERSGKLTPGGTIIEPTSGNTGIGLAMVAAVKGYKLILVMPESMSIERRRLMLAYGATFDLTPKEKGMSGAVERARELIEQTPNSWMP